MYYFMLYARIFCDSHLKDYSISIKLLQAIARDTYFGISANNNSFKTIDDIMADTESVSRNLLYDTRKCDNAYQ